VHRGEYAVIYHGRRNSQGHIVGRVVGASRGLAVHLQASRFPYQRSLHRIKTTTTGRNGRFQFTVTPKLATRYRVTALALTSRIVSFYVVAGFREVQPPTCSSQPKCYATSVFRDFYPPRVASKEGEKKWYLYQAVKRKGTGKIRRLRLAPAGTDSRKRLNATTFQNTFTFPIVYRPKQNRYRFGVCQRETERLDGFGMPHHYGPCGANFLPYKVLASPAVG